MEQVMWYSLGTFFLMLIFIKGYFVNTVKGLEKNLETQKQDFEKRIKDISDLFHRELLKVIFESKNPPKYAVGEKVGDFNIILWVGIGSNTPLSNEQSIFYYNKYEVFNTFKKEKTFISEKALIESLKKGEA